MGGEEYDVDDSPTFGEEEVPAPASSPLGSLRERRKKRRETLKYDLRVPGYDPEVFVRFKPVAQAKLVAATKRADKSKSPDALALANAALLIDACLGVFQLDSDGTPVSIDPDNLTHDEADWPKFDDRLGQLLADEGEILGSATSVCRALYENDMALSRHTNMLLEWSQSMNEDLDREHEGN